MITDSDKGSELCLDLEEIFIRIKFSHCKDKSVFNNVSFEGDCFLVFIGDTDGLEIHKELLINELAERLERIGYKK